MSLLLTTATVLEPPQLVEERAEMSYPSGKLCPDLQICEQNKYQEVLLANGGVDYAAVYK